MADLLDAFDVFIDQPPDGGDRHEGALSLVLETTPRKGKRKLPSLYVSTYQVTADRDVARVLKRLVKTVSALRLATTDSVYAMHPIRLGDRFGLYGRDFFSRDVFRRKLMRHGVEFAEDPYVVLARDATFSCEDWGSFQPTFAVMSVDMEESEQVKIVEGASVLFNLLAMRVGFPTASDLSIMRKALTGVTAVGSDEASALVPFLSSLNATG